MSNSQYYESEKIVALIHGLAGLHPTYRAFHAAGALYRGTFRALPVATEYTRAVHFQGEDVPVTVRFSLGGGDPSATPKQTVGMATKFYLPDGRVTDLVMLNAPSFPVKNVDELIGLVECFDPQTHAPDPLKLQVFLASHPDTASALGVRKSLPAPVSFANTCFYGIHVFRFVNSEGKETLAKYRWVPEDGVEGQRLEELQAQPHDYLFDRMKDRIAQRSCRFFLQLELAVAGDPITDPTILWPTDRQLVTIGTLELTAATTPEEIGDAILLHDPTRVTDGVETTDDPILHARRGAYDASVAYRTGGWHSCPFSKVIEEKRDV